MNLASRPNPTTTTTPSTATIPTTCRRSANKPTGVMNPSFSVDSASSTPFVDSASEILESAVPIIKDRLYFATCARKPASTPDVHFFAVDNVYVYIGYNRDFGPLNLAMVTKYCRKINRKLKLATLASKKLIHVTCFDAHKRVNAAFLAAAYGVLYLKMTPESAYRLVASESQRRRAICCSRNVNYRGGDNDAGHDPELADEEFVAFRDACVAQTSSYGLSLLDVLKGLKRAVNCGFYDPEALDVPEYEARERVENGDSNWIIPGKLLAFCGPHPRARVDDRGFPYHSPESYFDYFRQHKVKTVVRLNAPIYDGRRFSLAGFSHHHLYFPDGSTPNQQIVTNFLRICEKTDGAIAVHCKAGLGRTGSLIGCYLIKHHRFSAAEAIAWLRICRPGSVIGMQQNWLVAWENRYKAGAEEEEEEAAALYDAIVEKGGKAMPLKRGGGGGGFMRSSVEKLLSAEDDDLRNVAKENLVIGVVKDNLINGVDKRASRRSDSKRDVLSISGPRRNCWIEEGKLGPSKDEDCEDESKLSQGDLLNRRKLAVKNNFLVETVKRASTSKGKGRKTSPSSSAPAKVVTTMPTTTKTPIMTPPPTKPETTTLSTRSSGRLKVKMMARNSGDSPTSENSCVNHPTRLSTATSQRNSMRATNSAAAAAKNSFSPSLLSPVCGKAASTVDPTAATSLSSAKRLTSPAATRSATLRPSSPTPSAATAVDHTPPTATLSVSSKSGSSGGWITAKSPFKTLSSASRRSGGGTPSPPPPPPPPTSSAATLPLSRSSTPPLSRVATPPSPCTRRQRRIGVGYHSGRSSTAHVNNVNINNSIIEIRDDSYNNRRNKEKSNNIKSSNNNNSNNENSSNDRSSEDSENLALGHIIIESGPLKKL